MAEVSDKTRLIEKEKPRKEVTDKTQLIDEEGAKKQRSLLGQVFGLLSAMSWVISGICVQMLHGLLPPFELNCWRFGGPLVFLLMWGCYKKITICHPPLLLLLLFGLSLSFATNNYTYFGSLEFIGVGDAETIMVSSSLVFTAVVSVLFLKEKIGIVKAVSIVVCIIGVVCITQPDFIFHNIPLGDFSTKHSSVNNCITDQNGKQNSKLGESISDTTRDQTDENQAFTNETNKSACDRVHSESAQDTSDDYIGYIMVTITGLSSALTTLLIRGTKVGELTCDIQTIWTYCFALIVSAILMAIFETPTLPKDLNSSLYLTGHVAFSFIGTLCYYLGLNVASGVLVYLAYAPAVLFSMVAQYLIVYNIEPGHRNLLEIIGGVSVLIAAVINPLHQIIAEKSEKKEEREYELISSYK